MCPVVRKQLHVSCWQKTAICVLFAKNSHMWKKTATCGRKQPHVSCWQKTATCVLLSENSHMCPVVRKQSYVSCWQNTAICVLFAKTATYCKEENSHMCPVGRKRPYRVPMCSVRKKQPHVEENSHMRPVGRKQLYVSCWQKMAIGVMFAKTATCGRKQPHVGRKPFSRKPFGRKQSFCPCSVPPKFVYSTPHQRNVYKFLSNLIGKTPFISCMFVWL